MGVPVSRVDAALELLAEALAEAAFPADEIERLVRQRLDAIDLERADPGWRCSEAMMATLFPASERLSRPGEGNAESVARIDRAAVMRHWERHGHPAAATVVATGDFGNVDIVAVLERTVGRWVGQGAPAPPPLVPQTSPPGQAVVLHRAGAVQTELRLARVGPNRHTPTWAATQLAAFTLGGSMNSRLMAKLREEKGYTYGVHATVSPLATTGVLSIGAAVETGVTGAAVSDALAVTRRLVVEGVTDEERVFAADALVAGPRRMESSHQLAGVLAGVVEERLPDDFVSRNLERLEAATTADVCRRAAVDWEASGLTLVAVGDARQIEAPLRDLGYSDLRVEE
jgi:predicted Zn-dependent peptidase